MFSAGDAGGAGTVKHNANLVDFLFRNQQGIEERCSRDDRGSMLIVVKHRNLHRLAKHFFDVETFRSLDVLKIDPAESGLKQLTQLDDVFRVMNSRTLNSTS